MKKVLPIFLLLLAACTKDRVSDLKKQLALPEAPADSTKVAFYSLFINEFLAKESSATEPDWVEIYNPYNNPFTLKAGKWFLTDSIGEPNKYPLPFQTILPKGFLVIYCDSGDSVSTSGEVHTSFNLSSKGEQLGLFFQDSTGAFIAVDTLTFGVQNPDVSYGRSPNGSSFWQNFSTPTKGTSNP